jgi:hypothetical protein
VRKKISTTENFLSLNEEHLFKKKIESLEKGRKNFDVKKMKLGNL